MRRTRTINSNYKAKSIYISGEVEKWVRTRADRTNRSFSGEIEYLLNAIMTHEGKAKGT